MTTDSEQINSLAAETKPLDVDGVTAAVAGTIGFALAFAILFFMRSTLQANGDQWWLWTCGAGAVMGLLGIAYTTRRRAAYRAAGRTTK